MEDGACISAAIFTEVTNFSEPGSSSLFAHSVQEKYAPTYAEPKAGGNVSYIKGGERRRRKLSTDGFRPRTRGLNMNLSSDTVEDGPGLSLRAICWASCGCSGKGNWWENDGLDRLRSINMRFSSRLIGLTARLAFSSAIVR